MNLYIEENINGELHTNLTLEEMKQMISQELNDSVLEVRIMKVPCMNKEPQKGLEQDISHFLETANWTDNLAKGDLSNLIVEPIQCTHATANFDREH